MKLLAVDTSSLACSVALRVGDIVIERHEEQAREHTRLVVRMIEEVLEEGACRPGSLDALVLGRGPGSFIGMRIATALLKGLAWSSGLKIVPVSSLLAIAEQVFEASDADEVVVCQDAHMNEVYLGRFAFDGRVVAVGDEVLHPAGPIDALSGDGMIVPAGAGWDRYPELFEANAGRLEPRSSVLWPRARYLLPMAIREVDAGRLLDPAEVEPAYLRHTVATPPRQA